ncbi:hypothetical protein MtrunA17_Chr7g0226721 [Medicago truncatula]|uniref:Uncharacterized protein n=1 Tax=Medicago truncatula TaxID=3880 RepID=A0A396GXC1_MEDTR|nr:hypothetical protein MtrunA17_Chr7g0226721 [Medicago truncatula]
MQLKHDLGNCRCLKESESVYIQGAKLHKTEVLKLNLKRCLLRRVSAVTTLDSLPVW